MAGTDSTVGAETTEVLGGSYDLIRDFVRNEDRVISSLLARAPDSTGSLKSGFGDSRGPYRFNGTPMVITTESMAAQDRYLVFWSGPRNTSWSFPMRAAQQQTRAGTVYHSWRNSARNSFFDDPSVTFTFQSGNIMPVRVASSSGGRGTVALPPGLLDFYDFFDILNQPKILSDGRTNYVFIAYHSLVFPEVFMRGLFTPEGLSFQEDSQNPAEISWSATFKIKSTEPQFWNTSQLVAAWRSAFVSPEVEFDNLISELASTGGSTSSTPPSVLGTTGVPVRGQGQGG